MEKLFRTLKKVTNIPKPVYIQYETRIKEFNYDNNVKLVVTYQPRDIQLLKSGCHSEVKFQVFLNDKEKFIKYIRNDNLDQNVDKTNDDFFNDIDVQGYFKSIVENIVPLVGSKNLYKDYQRLGTANGWKDTPEIILKAREIRENTPYFVEYCEGRQIGRCWSETINHTFKYIYDVDSSD